MQFVSKPPEAPGRREMNTERAVGRTQPKSCTELRVQAKLSLAALSKNLGPGFLDKLRHLHIWKQTISHGHSRAAIVPIGALPVYHAVCFVFTLLAFSCALQISPPVFVLNQGLM